MNYQTAYEQLSLALWAYDKSQNDAYVRLLMAARAIDGALAEKPPPAVCFRPVGPRRAEPAK